MWLAILFLALSGSAFSASRPGKPKLVRIKAPKGASIAILAQPRADSQKKDTAQDGDILQVAGEEGGFVKVKLPHKKTFGFLHNDHTVPVMIIPSRGH